MPATAATLTTGGASPEIAAGQPQLEFDPQTSGGFLLQREDDSSVLVEVMSVNEDAYRGGTTQLDAYRITTTTREDGELKEKTHNYGVRTNIPNHLGSDTLVESTTPWTTRGGKGGFNDRFMARFNDLEYATLFVEPEGGAIGASLVDSADNLNYIGHIARHYRLSSDELRPDTTLYAGKSRAAAIGYGVVAAYADLIAPCYTEPGTRNELPKDALQLVLETAEVGKHLVSLGLRGAISQRRTFSANPMDLVHTVLAIPHLRSGDAGELSRSNSTDSTHVTLFRKDGWSRHDKVVRMAADRSDMHVSLLEGRHLSLAKPEVIEACLGRFAALAEMRGFDGNFEDVDFGEIWKIQPASPEHSNPLRGLSPGILIKAAYNLASTS